MKLVTRIGTVASLTWIAASAWAQTTSLVSVSSTGERSNGASHAPSASDDGRFVAFVSNADNLVPGDTNVEWDVFVRSSATSETERASVGAGGEEATRGSSITLRALSADGRYVVFYSAAPNLVAGDTNQTTDVFVRDRIAGTTERVSLSSFGEQGDCLSSHGTISRDGRIVAFESCAANLTPNDTNGQRDVFVRDLAAGTTERVSLDSAAGEGNFSSSSAALSGDGRFVAFTSSATNLVPGDTNGQRDVFVRDRVTGLTERVSLSWTGEQAQLSACESLAAALSADGRFVVFESAATNLVAGDTNHKTDVFVRDRLAGTTRRVNLSAVGAQSNSSPITTSASISSDGRLVAFVTSASDLVWPYDSSQPKGLYVRDLLLETTERWSVNTIGQLVNDNVGWTAAIAGDGSCAVFSSHATNLAPPDTYQEDVFLHTRRGCASHAFPHCLAKWNSAGCLPQIEGVGGDGGALTIVASQVLPLESGLLFYSTTGPAQRTFLGGHLCVRSPFRRTPIQSAGDGGAPPCTGTYSFDFGAYAASGAAPELIAGERVWAQYWMRDPGGSFGVGLTAGVTFLVCY